ncbi:MAG: archaeal proteasome endopeptidase complex subunit beta [Candidatus Bathyarchaeia archaeon]|nr:archaeal proteasome endopeptidase complex subunit beta [Candidatus Bathyarchaeota archaeon]
MSQMVPYIPGATTVGVVCSDGVVLASEKRFSYGYFVMSKTSKKVFKITDKIGAACAGLVGDMQILVKEAAAYLKLYSLEANIPISVRAAAKLIGNLLFQSRLYPYITQIIVGGIDEEGPKLFALDPLGSVIEDKYASVGTGAELAIGILEAEYKENLTIEEAKELVKKAIKAAVSRDAGSGNGIDILVITKNGIKEETVSFA